MIDAVNMVIPSITADAGFVRLVERLEARHGVLGISGLWGSSAPLLAAALHQTANRPILYVTAHLDEADEALDDLETFRGQRAELLPAWESLPGQGSGSGEIHGERLRLCAQLHEQARFVIVAPVLALLQPVPSLEELNRHTIRVREGATADPDEIVAWLVDRGFERLDRVESPGDFARRGDILDIYLPSRDDPVRLEFFDRQVETVRCFDISTHRSTKRLGGVAITAMPEGVAASPTERVTLIEHLPESVLLIVDRPDEVAETAETIYTRLNRPAELFSPSDLFRQFETRGQLHVTRIGASSVSDGDAIHFDVRSLARFEGKTDAAVRELLASADERRVVVFCHNDGERARLTELLTEHAGVVPRSIELRIGHVHQGFEWRSARTIVVPHHEIFHRKAVRRLRRSHASRPIESVLDLTPGDLVVHVVHGIARFRGMKTMRKGDSNKSVEFMTLEFAEKANLYVPTTQVDLVQKYVGAAGVKPTLSKLGGTRWRKTKEKVAEAVSELAESLLEVQAARSRHEGVAYPADTVWQCEFEESFPYEDTEDQVIVGREIKDDLAKPRPMDRLICGDVGYGKTELAIRAAFKVVEFGKQVAVLVPTTVLAEQHFRTFTERLAEYPFVVDCLSRFRTTRTQKDVIERAKKGQIDILIGTHRILSKDVGFANLGLVVIDEEQRFGVQHKERLKQMRTTVDVLTLSATPIPRTLHMSLVGLRDISALQSPPMDRRSIATHVARFDPELIRSAILRELNRDGQVYFVHNIVRSIHSMADTIRKLVPEARVLVGHGQMKEGELEPVMRAVLNRQADILVSTTIIESGLDIPNVNTIFINQADRFGLADLHQLRGRVGRSERRGYCYFLLPADRPVTPKAAKRLKAIEEFSDLGAGFRIAMRDLEIRGAGNLLGAEQSGHIAAVGYELYCQLLEKSVRRAKGQPDVETHAVHLELNMPAHISPSYISSERTRIEVYRRIAECRIPEDVARLEADLRDAFGKFPADVGRLMALAEIRVLAAQWKIRSIVLDGPDVVFTFDDLKHVQPAFENAPGSVRMPDPNTVHLRLPPRYLEPPTLLTTLRRLLAAGIAESHPAVPSNV